MKIVLAALNSQYIHSSLAPWYLKANCDSENNDIRVMEFTINGIHYEILRELCSEKPDLVGFSCYIFNITQIEDLAADLKKVLPDVKIVFGGPEVSYDAKDVLLRCKAAGYVISGEGETPFRMLAQALGDGKPVDGIPGVFYRDGETVRSNPPGYERLETLRSPYTGEMLAAARGRIAYFESSRGCPFHCSYCLSSVSGGTRFFPMEWVKAELSKLMRSQVRQIKFVDRTFNCNPKRAAEIVSFILESAEKDPGGAGAKNYHFEVAADLFGDDLIALFQSAPAGLFQLEIGIQSLNAGTLAGVDRKTDMDKSVRAIRLLLQNNNVHIHLDLIAGLPGEGYGSFAKSFDGLFALRPHCIQLGFLKLLKGSKMRRTADGMPEYAYESKPPYEVLRSPLLCFDELARLKDIAQCVDRLYNSGRFALSLPFAAGRFPSPFRFFEKFAFYLRARGCFDRSISLRELYGQFLIFTKSGMDSDQQSIFNELVKYDSFSTDRSCNPPGQIDRITTPNARELYAGKRGKHVHFETFAFDPRRFDTEGTAGGAVTLCFDYDKRDPVTGAYAVEKVRNR